MGAGPSPGVSAVAHARRTRWRARRSDAGQLRCATTPADARTSHIGGLARTLYRAAPRMARASAGILLRRSRSPCVARRAVDNRLPPRARRARRDYRVVSWKRIAPVARRAA